LLNCANPQLSPGGGIKLAAFFVHDVRLHAERVVPVQLPRTAALLFHLCGRCSLQVVHGVRLCFLDNPCIRMTRLLDTSIYRHLPGWL
jgi:hypothetical protein